MNNKQILIAIVTSILTGILLGQTEIYGLIVLALIFIFGLISNGIGLLVGKDRRFRSASLGLIVLIFICLISTILTNKLLVTNKLNNANEVIKSLENYKNEFGKYPEKLKTISNLDAKEEFSYIRDSIQNEFKLVYLIDGWHSNEYSSSKKEWIIKD